MDFAENLRQICSIRKTNPTALCKELGLSTSKVNAWYGGSLPKQEVLIKLAEKLNCSVMDFFAGENEEYSFLIVNDEDEEDILSVYRKLNRKMKHEFMAMVYEFEKRVESEEDRIM